MPENYIKNVRPLYGGIFLSKAKQGLLGHWLLSPNHSEVIEYTFKKVWAENPSPFTFNVTVLATTNTLSILEPVHQLVYSHLDHPVNIFSVNPFTI